MSLENFHTKPVAQETTTAERAPLNFKDAYDKEFNADDKKYLESSVFNQGATDLLKEAFEKIKNPESATSAIALCRTYLDTRKKHADAVAADRTELRRTDHDALAQAAYLDTKETGWEKDSLAELNKLAHETSFAINRLAFPHLK